MDDNNFEKISLKDLKAILNQVLTVIQLLDNIKTSIGNHARQINFHESHIMSLIENGASKEDIKELKNQFTEINNKLDISIKDILGELGQLRQRVECKEKGE